MTDAWGYVRLSQEGRDTSLDEQKRSIREYCRSNGLDLKTTRNDGKNASGFDQEREEYQLLREKIKKADIDAVVVRDRARLSRDFDDRLSLIVDLRESQVEWHVIEAGGLIDVSDVQTAGIECLHGMMGHVKKMAEIQRAKDAIEERIESGCYQGTPPRGLQFAPDGCHLEKTDEWEKVMSAFDLIENGNYTYTDIESETGIPASDISRMKHRGRSWYIKKFEEYGMETNQ